MAAYDIDPLAVEVYNRHVGNHARVADLADLRPEDIPDADGFVGGPPCQPFSRLSWAGLGDRDPRNALPELVRLVIAKRPMFFLIENVPDLLTVHSAYLAVELGRLQQAGYWVTPATLNAALYGVPQERRRLFVFGWRGRMAMIPEPTHSRRSAISARKAISAMLTEPEPMPNYLAHLAKAPDKLIDGANRSDHGKGRRVIQWRSLDRPSFTILASGNYRHKVYMSGQTYTLRTRHMAALQSFPPDWQWPEIETDAKRLIGNAVPPTLAYHLGRAIS